MSAEEKRLRQERAQRTSVIKWTLSGLVVFGAVVGLLVLGAEAEDPSDPLVSKNGVHWHAKLTIRANGESIEIPAGIGLVAGMEHPQQMHTHESDQIIHVEIPGRVTESETHLGDFFDVWGKEFSATAVAGVQATATQKVTMTVNGKEEPLLGAYPIKDQDDIVITLE